jgi:hypothetical protein
MNPTCGKSNPLPKAPILISILALAISVRSGAETQTTNNPYLATAQPAGQMQRAEEEFQKMAASEEMRRWWDLCEPWQKPVPTRMEGEWWARMEEVFHHD